MKYKIHKLLRLFLTKSGLLQLSWITLPNGVYVFNYHRIGDVNSTQFDRALYSCTEKSLNTHINEIKNNFEIISSEQLSDIVQKGAKITKRYAMITFDDGYYDNYSVAFPVLKKHKVPGIFYLATDLVGSPNIPWWDEIAYLLRKSCGSSYQLPSSSNLYQLDEKNIDDTIRRIIFEAKRLKNIAITEVVEHVRKNFPKAYSSLKGEEENLFMDWPDAIDMANNGMEIGSHTISHQILSQLSDSEQRLEITTSKKIIEEKLSKKIISIAYPVGRYHCFNEVTCKESELAGYKIAFNNEPGNNRTINNKYSINRICVDTNDINTLKFSTRFS